MPMPTSPWGICGRSGRRLRRVDMVFDGEFPQMLVDPRWREEPHPQEKPSIKKPQEIRVRRPAPDRFSSGLTRITRFVDLTTGTEWHYGAHLVIESVLNVEVFAPFCFFPEGGTETPAGVTVGTQTVRFSVK